ncbi:unnamed protein product [Penicillium olsonii]|nr:unnamed protein product [Penicillium olsonii]
MIMIGPMDATEATTLFAKKLGVQITEDVSQLVKELDHMPLAIAQAAALIKHMEPRLSVSQYLRRFQKSEREKIRFLAHDQGQLSRDKEAHNSIIVTWQMSFDHIRRTHPSAADLLSLMCFFDRQGIPENLIRRSLGYTVDASSTSQDEGCGDYDDFESTTQDADHATEWTLEKACSNEEDTPVDGTSFQMHRLVQLAMRRWLETHKQTERWKRCFIRTLSSEVQDAEYENWPVCELVLPHVLSAVTQPPIEETTMEKWAAVIHVAAAFTCHRGDHSKSAELASLASETTGRLLGPYHESTLCSLGALAAARQGQGQYKAAEEILVQLLEIRKRILGSEHPQTVTIMHDLATLYYHQGRYIEAENIGFQALEIRKRILGLNHPATLMSMGNLAAFRGNQGRYSEAEMDELQLLEMRKRLVDPDHPATLCSMSNLATTYFDQGRYIEAEDILVQVVEIRKRIIGWDHPDTLGSFGNLASIYLAQGRHRDAEDIGVRVLETRQRILGWDHPDTLYSMNNLAFIYFDQGRYTESEEMGRQAIEMRNRIIGPEHPDTMVSMKNYAVTLWYLGQHESALLLLARCTELSTRVLGPQHPCTNTFLGCLDRYRQIYNHLPPQTTGAPFERPPEAICRFDSQSTSAEASDEASGPSKARKRTMLTRLFRKKKNDHRDWLGFGTGDVQLAVSDASFHHLKLHQDMVAVV